MLSFDRVSMDTSGGDHARASQLSAVTTLTHIGGDNFITSLISPSNLSVRSLLHVANKIKISVVINKPISTFSFIAQESYKIISN